MPTACTSSRTRNQSMECFKMIASILVVFLHISFPGQLGTAISILGSVAVPMFFAITGYFNYGADRTAVIRRLKHLLRLYLIVIVTSVVCGVISTELRGGSTVAFLRTYCPDLEEVMRLLILHQDPRNAQLWYLISVGACYLFLLLYLDFRGEARQTTDRCTSSAPASFPCFCHWDVWLRWLTWRFPTFCGLTDTTTVSASLRWESSSISISSGFWRTFI